MKKILLFFSLSSFLFNSITDIHAQNWIRKDDIRPAGLNIAISGDFVIIGYEFDDVGGLTNSGSAYIYKHNGTSWTQQAKLTASDAGDGDGFGYDVKISGDYAIIGTSPKNPGGTAYIFKRDGTSWTEQAKLTAADAGASDIFGFSVAISGDIVIIGASQIDDPIKNTFSGYVYVFKQNGSNWTKQAKLSASDASVGDRFGHDVEISGDYAIIAMGTSPKNPEGAAYIFKRDGTSWTEQAKLTASDAVASTVFGLSVAISEDTAIVGARTGGGSWPFALYYSAYVFKRDGTNWTQQAKLRAIDPSYPSYLPYNDNFGGSISISGDRVIIGASNSDEMGMTNIGAAYIYKYNGTSYTQETKLTDSATVFGIFGLSVAISGGRALVCGLGYAHTFELDHPQITCPINIAVNSDPKACGAIVRFLAKATGVPEPKITYTHASGSFFPVGNTEVTATATNEKGTSECTFTITVKDTEPPVIIASPKNITLISSAGTSGTIVSFDAPTATDNCEGIIKQIAGLASGAFFPIGKTTNTFEATDGTGNRATCSFDITVVSDGLSVTNNEIEEVKLYPNPTRIGVFTLDIPQGVNDLEVTIYNPLGSKVFHETGFKSGTKATIKTDFTTSDGIYFVKLSSEGKTTIKKLIVNEKK